MVLRPLVFLLIFLAQRASSQSVPADAVVDFLKANPVRSALYLIRNDTVQLSLRPDQKMPLASAVKTIVAIEFARQAATGRIDPAERVAFADLDLYYLPNTDGGAHPEWKQWLTRQKLDSGNTASLLEVAKGMIQFSSNANFEYLLDRLGSAAVNANRKALNLPQHDLIYPITSALFLYSVHPADSAKAMTQVRRLSPAAYAARAQAFHNRLKQDRAGTFKKTFLFPSLPLQKIWSDRLPAATVREYASVMQKINSRTYFPPAVQAHLDSIMEWPMVVNPGNKALYRHLGAKGGSTAFVLTNALYADTVKGDRVSVAVFFNNLTLTESEALMQQLNVFTLRCFGGKASKSLVEALAH